jgi:hypothetical protein
MLMKRYRFAALLAFTAAAVCSRATVIWDEAINGGLSQDYVTATALPAFGVGSNTVLGQAQIVPFRFGWTTYTDYFTFSLPDATKVTSIVLNADDTNLWIWIGTPDFATQLGFVGFLGAGWGVPPPSNGDLLPQMSLSGLSAGTYGMYISDRSTDSVARVSNYSLDFNVGAAPVPDSGSVATLVLVAFTGLAFVRRHLGFAGRR